MPKTLMDGTEQVLFESTEMKEYTGYIFLDKLVGADALLLKLYIKDVEDNIYKLRDSLSVVGSQVVPCIGMLPITSKVGIKLTAQQVAGTYKEITHMWFGR